MAVYDNQAANQGTFNGGLMSRLVDTSTAGRVDLLNSVPESGANVINIQRELNSLFSFTGRPAGSAFDLIPLWADNQVGAITDNLKTRADALTTKLGDPVLGHTHSGLPGEGPLISAENLANFNQFFVVNQAVSLIANGTSEDVSSLFTGKSPNGSATSIGVLTDPSNNRVYLIDEDTQTFLEDTEGQRIYGRITESSGVWTLSFFTNEAGTETPASITSTSIRVIFREVFDAATRPTIGEWTLDFGSVDLTADIADASATQRGLVSTSAQTYSGLKTMQDGLSAAFLRVFERDENSAAVIDDLDTTKGLINLTNTVTTINGATNTETGKKIYIFNDTGSDVTINHESLSAVAAERFKFPDALPRTLADGECAGFIYSSFEGRWIPFGGQGGGGGSGSNTFAISAFSPGPDAATQSFENALRYWEFNSGGTEGVYAFLKVPESYVAGTQIFLRSQLIINSAGGVDYQFRTQSTLIKDLELVTSSSNQRVSTNGPTSVVGVAAGRLFNVEFDLTSAIGEINSVAVEPGDLIKIKIYRTDSQPGVQSVIDFMEVNF